jgi:hypothetical protein
MTNSDSDLESGRRTASNEKRNPAVHVACKQYPASQSAISTLDIIASRPSDKPPSLSLDDILESSVGK